MLFLQSLDNFGEFVSGASFDLLAKLDLLIKRDMLLRVKYAKFIAIIIVSIRLCSLGLSHFVEILQKLLHLFVSVGSKARLNLRLLSHLIKLELALKTI